MTCTHVCPVGMSRMSCVIAGTFCKVCANNVRTFLPSPDATRTRTISDWGLGSAGRVEGRGSLCNGRGRRCEGGRLLEYSACLCLDGPPEDVPGPSTSGRCMGAAAKLVASVSFTSAGRPQPAPATMAYVQHRVCGHGCVRDGRMDAQQHLLGHQEPGRQDRPPERQDRRPEREDRLVEKNLTDKIGHLSDKL